MSIGYEEYTKVGVVTIDGDLAGDAAARLREAVDAALAGGRVVDVVIDLGRSRFIDSQGLEALLWARRRAESAAGRVKLTGLDANARKVLEITRLDRRFECHPDVASALKAT